MVRATTMRMCPIHERVVIARDICLTGQADGYHSGRTTIARRPPARPNGLEIERLRSCLVPADLQLIGMSMLSVFGRKRHWPKERDGVESGYTSPICVWRATMVRNGLRTIIVGALITIGYLAPASAAPIVPSAMTALIGSHADFASFHGLPFPFGYAYRHGQCYIYEQVETPRGLRWRRIWICTESGGLGYGEGGRF